MASKSQNPLHEIRFALAGASRRFPMASNLLPLSAALLGWPGLRRGVQHDGRYQGEQLVPCGASFSVELQA